MLLLTAGLFVLGIGLLIVGADVLVRGASQLATLFGIPPLIIGLTVVAMGTSSPELAVSLQSAFAGQADLTLGNVVGSNISNVLLILGLAALIAPLIVSPELLRRDTPVMIGVSLLLYVLAMDGSLNRLDGAILLVGLVIYMLFTVRSALGGASGNQMAGTPRPLRAILLSLGAALLGLAMLVIGANWIVGGAVAAAAALGISELVIGLTVVAVGTSLPEIATSVLAGVRGERDIAVGNVVGSNILNLLAVLGLTLVLAPAPVAVPPSAFALDLPVMLAAALACLPIFYVDRAVTRFEGGLLLSSYLLYTLYLVLNATNSAAREPVGAVLTLVVLPVITAIIVVRLLRTIHAEHKARIATREA